LYKLSSPGCTEIAPEPKFHADFQVVPDAATERAAAGLGERLDAILKPWCTGTNALTFLLPQHTPDHGGNVERVRQVFRPAHYARLATLKARYDPDNLLGGDWNIPPFQ